MFGFKEAVLLPPTNGIAILPSLYKPSNAPNSIVSTLCGISNDVKPEPVNAETSMYFKLVGNSIFSNESQFSKANVWILVTSWLVNFILPKAVQPLNIPLEISYAEYSTVFKAIQPAKAYSPGTIWVNVSAAPVVLSSTLTLIKPIQL